MTLLAALALGACAGELDRAHRPVEIATPALDATVVDAQDDDAFVPVDARTSGRDAGADADLPPAPGAELRVFVRVHADAWAVGLRAGLEPPQPALGDVGSSLAALGPGAVPVFDFDRPDDAAEARLRAHLAQAPATVLFSPERHPESLETDLRHLAAWVLDDARCARFGDAPVLFVAPPASGALLSDTLERVAALPHRTAVLLGFDPLSPTPLPAGLSDAARAQITGRWSTRASGWSADGTGDVPDAAEARALAEGWREAALDGPVVPLARPARNPRRDRAGEALESPGADAGLLRSLVLARRSAAAGDAVLLVDGLSAWSDDTQLDAVDPDVPRTDAPAALTGGHLYPAYGTRRLDAVREALLTAPGAPPDPGTAPVSLAELQRSDSVVVERLELVAGRVEVALRDRAAGGRLTVLLDHRRFRVPPGASVTYGRTAPSLRVEWVLAGEPLEGPEAVPTTLRALAPDVPPTGDVVVDARPLAGRIVDSVVLVYDGGAGALQASVTLPFVTSAP
jgi:hypothetical protein